MNQPPWNVYVDNFVYEAVLLEVERAFDRVWKDALIHKIISPGQVFSLELLLDLFHNSYRL